MNLSSHAHSVLKWYSDIGIDETIDHAPTNHFLKEIAPDTVKGPSQIAATNITNNITQHPPQVISSSSQHEQYCHQARTLANQAKTIDELKAAIEGFEGCELKKSATQTVFGDGNPRSNIILIGEAPGAEEDKQGIPFCGASGQLLDTMFGHIGLSRKENFFISNAVYWRPPGNRQPTNEEIELCKPFMEKLIALIHPALLIAIGGTAAKSLLNNNKGITRLRKEEFMYSNPYLKNEIPIKALFHPSYLLRQPLQKKLVWHDLLHIKKNYLSALPA